MPPTVEQPRALQDRAFEDLSFIRSTMARAAPFTSVPGWGGVVMGATALVAGAVATQVEASAEWLAVWLAEAVIAIAIGGLFLVRKAGAGGGRVLNHAVRLFAGSFVPAVAAGVVLTPVLFRLGLATLLPGLWLLLYGAGVASAGAFSVKVVPAMGWGFMGLGVLAFLAPANWGNWFLVIGFGGFHIVFGWIIARRYGG